MKSIDVGELIGIASAILGRDPHTLASETRIDLAESALNAPFAAFGDVELYDTIPKRGAILCSRIVRNHPFPNGNKRTAYLAMIELFERNDHRFDESDQEHIAETIERLAASELDEEEFVEWVEGRTAAPDRGRR